GFERVCLFLGGARDAVFVAQQMDGLLVEDLPGEHARLFQDFAAILGVGIAVKVGAFVEEAMTPCIDDDAKRGAVLLEAVANIEIADRWGVEVPGAGMRA